MSEAVPTSPSPAPKVDGLRGLLFGPSMPERVPARVADAIALQDRNSEIVIGFVQLGTVVFFWVFYAISPKAFPASTMLHPVPMTLAIYVGFTAVRLFLAFRQALPPWLIATSIFIDIAVLMITIWSFHLQYEQPPGLYLKAPTVLYVFIFVALRALKFDPRWVVLAGGAAASGWLVLVFYALAHGTVTHSYVEYMTSLDILIGAEVDKLVAIGAVTAILGLALVRARRLLVRAVTDAAATVELSRFFAPEIAETIKAADQPARAGEGVLREAAAMFVDLRGFTTLASSLDPHALVALLGEYQKRVLAVVRKHRGSITTYLGDGVMITFGATRPSLTFAADALAAAEELLDLLDRWQNERRSAGSPAPGFGIGICTGTVIYGAIGDEGRLEYAVIGDPVNRAAKIQDQTKAEGVRALAHRTTVELAAAQGHTARDFRLIRARLVDGIAEPLDLAVVG